MMEKRTDYLNGEREHSKSNALNDGVDSGIDNLTVGISGAIASANTMQSSAHSTGLLFEQSINQQNNMFLSSMTNTIKSTTELLDSNVKLKGTKLARKNNLFQLLLDNDQTHT